MPGLPNPFYRIASRPLMLAREVQGVTSYQDHDEPLLMKRFRRPRTMHLSVCSFQALTHTLVKKSSCRTSCFRVCMYVFFHYKCNTYIICNVCINLRPYAHSGPGKQISYTFSIDEKLALFYKPHFT